MEGVFMVALFFVGMFIGMLTLSLVAINRENHEAAAAREETARITRSYQALVLADDFYSEMQYRKNRLHQMQFDMQYAENDFTEQWSKQERGEIAKICEEMLEQERRDYIANLEDVSERGDVHHLDPMTRPVGSHRPEREDLPATGPTITLDDVIAEEPDYSEEASHAF